MSYPTTLDSFTNPNAATGDTLASVPHDAQHTKANTAITALEAKVGIDASAATTSIDYKLKNAASIDPGHHHTTSTLDSIASTKVTGVTFPGGAIVGTSDTQTLTNKTLTDSTNNVMAKSLKSATTTVDVSAATAPSANQVLTATDSTHATWQTSAGAGFNSGCSVYSSANLTLAPTTSTKINFDTKVYDLNSEFNTTTNTFTATSAGKYLVTCSGYIVTLASGKLFQLYIYKNGSEAHRNTYQAAGGSDLVSSVSAIVSLAAGDTITFEAFQGDTGNQTLAGANPNRTYAMIQRLY